MIRHTRKRYVFLLNIIFCVRLYIVYLHGCYRINLVSLCIIMHHNIRLRVYCKTFFVIIWLPAGLLAGFLGVVNDFPTHSPPLPGFQIDSNQTPPNQSQRILSPNNNYSPKSNNTSPSQVVQDKYPVLESITVKHEFGEKSHTDKLKSSRSYQPQDTSIPFDEGFVQVKPLSNATNTSTR